MSYLVPGAWRLVPRVSCLVPRVSCLVPRASCIVSAASCLVPCRAMPCHAMPCHVMPCHAMSCHQARTCVRNSITLRRNMSYCVPYHYCTTISCHISDQVNHDIVGLSTHHVTNYTKSTPQSLIGITVAHYNVTPTSTRHAFT